MNNLEENSNEQVNFQGKTIQRLLDFLKARPNDLFTPTDLRVSLGINYPAINGCLRFLAEVNQARILTNGKVRLIGYKGDLTT